MKIKHLSAGVVTVLAILVGMACATASDESGSTPSFEELLQTPRYDDELWETQQDFLQRCLPAIDPVQSPEVLNDLSKIKNTNDSLRLTVILTCIDHGFTDTTGVGTVTDTTGVETRVIAARVGDQEYTQGDIVARIRLERSIAAELGQTHAVDKAPFEVLSELTQAGIIRRAAPGFNIFVTEDDIDRRLREIFDPGQPDQEFRERYQTFLTSAHISDSDYREIMEESILRERTREKLGERILSVAESVELRWIVLPAGLQVTQQASPQVNPDEVRQQVDEEDFAAVAAEVNTDRQYADGQGYVGWVPRDAFTGLDKIIYGDPESGIEPMQVNEIRGPIFQQDGTYIIQMLDEPAMRETNDLMRERMKDQALSNWLIDQQIEGGREGWLEVENNTSIYGWVLEQVAKLDIPDPAQPTQNTSSR